MLIAIHIINHDGLRQNFGIELVFKITSRRGIEI